MEFMEFFPTWQRDSWWPRFIDRWPRIRMRPFCHGLHFLDGFPGDWDWNEEGVGVGKKGRKNRKDKRRRGGAEIETTATTLIDI